MDLIATFVIVSKRTIFDIPTREKSTYDEQ